MAAPEEPPANRAHPKRPQAGQKTLHVIVDGPVEPTDIPDLCERLAALLPTTDAVVVVCDVGALAPDAVTVDALARLQLTAQRFGRRIRLRHACGELQELLVMVGLADVVPPYVGLPLEPQRQAEEREQAGRVEEETDPGDPSR